jgi:outer membrane lipoprotein-sorting protein
MRLLGITAALVSAAAAAAPAAAQTARPQPAATAQARATNVDALLERAGRAYKGAKSVRAGFEQTLINPLTGSTTVQAGTLFQQGKRWSARFSEPRGDRYVLNGRTLWVYTRAPRRSRRCASRSTPTRWRTSTCSSSSRGEPREQFTITAAGAAAWRVAPRPRCDSCRSRRDASPTPWLWIDDRDGTVRQFELTESTGLVRRVRLHDVRFNAAIPAAEFAFTPPRGAGDRPGSLSGGR